MPSAADRVRSPKEGEGSEGDGGKGIAKVGA